MTPVFEITESRDFLGRRRWRWNLLAGNGEVVATSEAYNSLASARGGAEAVRRISPLAEILAP